MHMPRMDDEQKWSESEIRRDKDDQKQQAKETKRSGPTLEEQLHRKFDTTDYSAASGMTPLQRMEAMSRDANAIMEERLAREKEQEKAATAAWWKDEAAGLHGGAKPVPTESPASKPLTNVKEGQPKPVDSPSKIAAPSTRSGRLDRTDRSAFSNDSNVEFRGTDKLNTTPRGKAQLGEKEALDRWKRERESYLADLKPDPHDPLNNRDYVDQYRLLPGERANNTWSHGMVVHRPPYTRSFMDVPAGASLPITQASVPEIEQADLQGNRWFQPGESNLSASSNGYPDRLPGLERDLDQRYSDVAKHINQYLDGEPYVRPIEAPAPTPAEKATSFIGDIKTKLKDVKESVEDKFANAKSRVEDQIVIAKAKVEDKIDQAKEKAQDVKEKAQDKLEDAKGKAQGVKEKVQDKLEDAKEKAQDKFEDAKQKAQDVKEKAQDKWAEGKDKVEAKFESAKPNRLKEWKQELEEDMADIQHKIVDKTNEFTTVVRGKKNDLKEDVKDATKEVKGGVSKLKEKIKDEVEEIEQDAKSLAQKAQDSWWNPFNRGGAGEVKESPVQVDASPEGVHITQLGEKPVTTTKKTVVTNTLDSPAVNPGVTTSVSIAPVEAAAPLSLKGLQGGTNEIPDVRMPVTVKKLAKSAESKFSSALSSWTGSTSEISPIHVPSSLRGLEDNDLPSQRLVEERHVGFSPVPRDRLQELPHPNDWKADSVEIKDTELQGKEEGIFTRLTNAITPSSAPTPTSRIPVHDVPKQKNPPADRLLERNTSDELLKRRAGMENNVLREKQPVKDAIEGNQQKQFQLEQDRLKGKNSYVTAKGDDAQMNEDKEEGIFSRFTHAFTPSAPKSTFTPSSAPKSTFTASFRAPVDDAPKQQNPPADRLLERNTSDELLKRRVGMENNVFREKQPVKDAIEGNQQKQFQLEQDRLKGKNSYVTAKGDDVQMSEVNVPAAMKDLANSVEHSVDSFDEVLDRSEFSRISPIHVPMSLRGLEDNELPSERLARESRIGELRLSNSYRTVAPGGVPRERLQEIPKDEFQVKESELKPQERGFFSKLFHVFDREKVNLNRDDANTGGSSRLRKGLSRDQMNSLARDEWDLQSLERRRQSAIDASTTTAFSRSIALTPPTHQSDFINQNRFGGGPFRSRDLNQWDIMHDQQFEELMVETME